MSAHRPLTTEQLDALVRLARTTDGDWAYRLVLKNITDEYPDDDLSDDDCDDQETAQ